MVHWTIHSKLALFVSEGFFIEWQILRGERHGKIALNEAITLRELLLEHVSQL